MKRILAFIMCVTFVGFVQADDSPSNIVSSNAVGEIESVPDIVIVSGRVSAVENNAERAITLAQDNLDSLIRLVKNQKIPSSNLQAASVMVQPQWRYPKNKAREITGYQAYSPFTIRLHQIEKLSSLYVGLSGVGISEINQISFDFSDRQELELKAIKKAVVIAQNKAQAAASAVGQQIGSAKNIQINTRWNQPVMSRARTAMMAESDAVAPQINVGSHKLSATVQVDFELK
jgi:uncharacterized protein YggE